jgi:hypothetical protein
VPRNSAVEGLTRAAAWLDSRGEGNGKGDTTQRGDRIGDDTAEGAQMPRSWGLWFDQSVRETRRVGELNKSFRVGVWPTPNAEALPQVQ